MTPPIRKGDGTVIEPQGIQQVRKGDGTVLFNSGAPNTVEYQYRAENFGTSTWTDSAGSADMSVNGMTASTFSNGEDSVRSDGVDDVGTASGPETLPSNETFGVAFTFSSTDKTDPSSFTALQEANSDSFFGIADTDLFNGSNGQINLILRDSNNESIVRETTTDFMDGNPHAVIINKRGNDASDIKIYVDDMNSTTGMVIGSNQNFSHTDYVFASFDMAFFGRNNTGTIQGRKEFDAGIFEFNNEPYSQTERQAFVSRRPEV